VSRVRAALRWLRAWRLLPLVLGLLALTACSSAQLPTTNQILSARDKTELAVTLAGQALPVVQAEVDRLIAAGVLPPDKADQAKAALVKADTVLAIAEAWLAGKGDAPGRDEVLAALDAAELAVSLSRAGGGKLPAIVDQAIRLARTVIEEPAK